MQKVFFISGLGADKRVFSLLDLSFCEPVFIDWVPPLKNESLKNYALRLQQQITEPSPVIVGISFGGMLVTEMAKENPSVNAIILSSSKTFHEFPVYFKTAKYLPVYKVIPASLLKYLLITFRNFFSAKGAVQKKILYDILKDTNIAFVKWALQAILHWDNTIVPANLIHVHGNQDKLLPYRLAKPDFTVDKGAHLMPLNQPAEISALLKKIITST
jgi:pimeloyl-ACP methyl ester carboxylesterase